MIENYPLYWPDGWKRTPRSERRRLPADVAFGRARDRLMKELELLGAMKIVLSTNVPLRRDGLPYAESREPDDPGVAVYFDYRRKPMCFASDSYFTVRDNVRAIALTIEALRGIERWGASDMIERAFRGFAALPERASSSWRSVFGFEIGAPVTVAAVESRFRQLARERHPDAGGNSDRFFELTQAREAARRECGELAGGNR